MTLQEPCYGLRVLRLTLGESDTVTVGATSATGSTGASVEPGVTVRLVSGGFSGAASSPAAGGIEALAVLSVDAGAVDGVELGVVCTFSVYSVLSSAQMSSSDFPSAFSA